MPKAKRAPARAPDPEFALVKGIPVIAAVLGLPVADTYRLAAAGRIPGVGKVGRRYLGKLAKLREFDPSKVMQP